MSSTATLDSCVLQLRKSVGSVRNVNTVLEEPARRMTRLKTILAINRECTLKTEAEVQDAQQRVFRQVRPTVERLIARAESHLTELDKREHVLTMQIQNNARRLDHFSAESRTLNRPTPEQIKLLDDLLRKKEIRERSLRSLQSQKRLLESRRRVH